MAGRSRQVDLEDPDIVQAFLSSPVYQQFKEQYVTSKTIYISRISFWSHVRRFTVAGWTTHVAPSRVIHAHPALQ